MIWSISTGVLIENGKRYVQTWAKNVIGQYVNVYKSVQRCSCRIIHGVGGRGIKARIVDVRYNSDVEISGVTYSIVITDNDASSVGSYIEPKGFDA